MSDIQSGILADVPELARYIFFSQKNSSPHAALKNLAENLPDNTVVGFGAGLCQSLNKEIPGLTTFPAQSANDIDIPSTPCALWMWLRGDDRGELLHRTRDIQAILGDDFVVEHAIDAFKYREGRDLSGYIDGTENPEGDDAVVAAAITEGELKGSSFVAVQQWLHDLDHLQAHTQQQQDDFIGRRVADNVEFPEAPPSAHVKRTAQEQFSPEAFVLRRSMPWANETDNGLVFVAFGHSFRAFEVQLDNMLGKNDGITDGLFQFTRPISGNYFWCPPTSNDKLDLSTLGL